MNIPHRFREEAFRRYEATIAAIITKWPAASVFNPAAWKLSSVTFSCRLRDAMTSYLTYHWATTAFTDQDFDRMFAEKVVREQADGSVMVCPRGSATVPMPSAAAAPAEPLTIEIVADQAEADIQLRTIALLAHHRALCRPVKIVPAIAGSVLKLDYIQSGFDLFIEPTDNGGFIIT